MARATVWGGGLVAVVGVALFAGCSAPPEGGETTGSASQAVAPVCLGNVIGPDPWLVDAQCSCAPGGTQEFEDACSYEQGLVSCLQRVGYRFVDCNSWNLPQLLFILGSDKQRWSVLDPGYVRGFGCDQQGLLLQCIADLNANGKGPDGVPFSMYPVEGEEVPYCSPNRKTTCFNKVDAFDPCGFKGCLQ